MACSKIPDAKSKLPVKGGSCIAGQSQCCFVPCGPYCRLHEMDVRHSNLSLNGMDMGVTRKYSLVERCVSGQSAGQHATPRPPQRARAKRRRKNTTKVLHV